MAADPTLSSRRAAIALVALCLTSALGVAVAGYLALFSRALELGTRQFQNDRASELAQTGLEEALWALNQGDWSSSGPAGNTAWSSAGAARTVTLDYGDLGHGATGQVRLTVDGWASTGPAWPTIAVEATLTLNTGRIVTRRLTATTGPAPLFGNAIASAEGSVSFSAGGTVDSWNSDPDNDPATAAVPYANTGAAANHAAVIAGRDNGTHGVVLTQATIRGYVATFGQPVSYSVSASPPARVLGPSTPAAVNVDTSRLGRSAFVPVAPVFTVVPPPTSGPAYGGLIGTTLALVNALLGAPPDVEVYRTSGDLTIAGIPLLSPNLTVDRPLKIIVAGNLTITGAGKITINPGASLQLFVEGDCTIGGNGIDNRNPDPASCAIFCTDSSTTDSLRFATGADFRGVVYCEHKPIEVRENATFYGALLSRQRVAFTGSATAPVLHYDLALRSRRFSHVTTPYVLRTITES
ncbi:MAG TPA: hypothetical protein VEB66_07195 [Opitutaceae bacterium]|nr:hypothetical protein [Opitutaceae bacterium]